MIELDRLTKRYGSTTALDGISLQVLQGEFLALLGPSGCGKTTLLRSIAGFVEPSSGSIWIDNRDMRSVPPELRPVNTVFQSYALFPHMTAEKNIAFGLQRRRVPKAQMRAQVGEVLEMVGMSGFRSRFPSELSGGQQQRIALARAIVNRPKALLLDEPLSALDQKLRKRMQIELKRLHAQLGITFIYVTHDQEEALVMADRIAVMQDGRLAQLGTSERTYYEPASRYVAEFIGEANLLDCLADEAGRLTLVSSGKSVPGKAPPKTCRATLMVRPEDIEIGRAGETGACELSGRIRERIFLGSSIKLVVQLADGEELTIQPHSVATAETLQAGDAVIVHWTPKSARILPA